ncbi:MAG: hypothetical protein LR015_00600 [Verrucomicrobia bacterium]|nr:hypothetical protein [Verrucomicrobiota bacterium]
MEITKHGRVVAILSAPKRERPWKVLRGCGEVLADAEEVAVKETHIDSLQ